MRRVAWLMLVALTVSGAALALAASPKKGGLYSGTKPGVVSKKITLKVSSNGKSAIADLYCADTHARTMRKIVISKGRFSGTQKVGSVVVWTLKGSFTSPTAGTATVYLHSVCEGGVLTVPLSLTG